MNDPRTTPQQRDAFQRHGCLILPGLFDDKAMADVLAWTEEVVSWPEVPGRHMVYYEDSRTHPGERILTRIEDFCPYHEGLRDLLTGPEVLGRVSELFGEPAVLFKDKINFKMPGGDGFTPHQDVQAGWDTYASLHITMLLSIDATHPENGCLELAPSADRGAVAGRQFEPLTDAQVAAMEFEPCPTEPGDAVFFDSLIPHRSGPNLTDQPRRVLYVTYNRRSEGDHLRQYYADKRKNYPPDCERDPDRDYVFRV